MTPQLTVFSDWHLGAVRSAGTTPITAYELRQALLGAAEELLAATNSDLLINGDLFDGPDISKADLLRAFQIFGDWLTRTGKHLYLANGNHDLAKSSLNFSAFQLFAALLIETHGPERVTHIVQGTRIEKYDAYVIPHVANQDLFDLELKNMPACTYLFVHANYDNGFAVESDHSLNMSEQQAKDARCEHIIFGHEHQAKRALGKKVWLIGNQFPSSVSDCLGNDTKEYFVITDEGPHVVNSWIAEGGFSEQDWHSLEDRGSFIRVTGTATADEADKLVTTMARFRKDAKALVITNAVKIEGFDDSENLSMSHEAVTNFNVHEALMKLLTPSHQEKVNKLLESQNA